WKIQPVRPQAVAGDRHAASHASAVDSTSSSSLAVVQNWALDWHWTERASDTDLLARAADLNALPGTSGLPGGNAGDAPDAPSAWSDQLATFMPVPMRLASGTAFGMGGGGGMSGAGGGGGGGGGGAFDGAQTSGDPSAPSAEVVADNNGG